MASGVCGVLRFQCTHLRISKIGIKKIFFQKPPDSVTIQDSPYHGGVWGTGCYRKSEGRFQDINVFILKTWKLEYSGWALAPSQTWRSFSQGPSPHTQSRILCTGLYSHRQAQCFPSREGSTFPFVLYFLLNSCIRISRVKLTCLSTI